MPKYVVEWTELNHFSAGVEADSEEQAQKLAFTNRSDWQENEFGGYEENSITVRIDNA